MEAKVVKRFYINFVEQCHLSETDQPGAVALEAIYIIIIPLLSYKTKFRSFYSVAEWQANWATISSTEGQSGR